MTKIKICGLTLPKEAGLLTAPEIAMAGMVMFVPKSHRNISPERAEEIRSALPQGVKAVAVMIAPTPEQAKRAAATGVDYLQIHGEIAPEVLRQSSIPILKAFNIKDLGEYERYRQEEKIAGFVFDAGTPGSGQTFDWSILERIERDEKLFLLAGGLHAGNVEEAVRRFTPDLVDVSSGVERSKQEGYGKDPDKIEAFAEAVRKANVNI